MDFPADLLELKRAFFAADALCHQLAEALPSHRELTAELAGLEGAELEQRLAEIEKLNGELDAARRERLQIVLKVHRHEWWTTVPNRHDGELALRKAAQSMQSE